jgi:predicted enzyme related to lactoylglutathione lyase
MGKPVVHWEINTKDPARLHEFYAELFGWKIDANNPINYGLVDTGDKRGINGGIGPTDGENYVTFYVEVEDLQAYLDKAVKLGGKVVVPPTEIPGMVTFAMFTDPEGNRTGLVKG